jgi:hypothetical protein
MMHKIAVPQQGSGWWRRLWGVAANAPVCAAVFRRQVRSRREPTLDSLVEHIFATADDACLGKATRGVCTPGAPSVSTRCYNSSSRSSSSRALVFAHFWISRCPWLRKACSSSGAIAAGLADRSATA